MKYDGPPCFLLYPADVEVELDADLELSIAQQCFVFLLILCRWLLPRGKISRNQLSSLMFVFIGKYICFINKVDI